MNYAVLCDLNSINISFATFEKALESLGGKIVYSKFYSYNSKRNNDYTSFIRQHGSQIAVPLANRKKIRVDIRQVIDAITLTSDDNIEGIFLICSQVDALAMIQAIKAARKQVAIGVTTKSFLAEQCDRIIMLDRMAGLDNNMSNATSSYDSANIANELTQDDDYPTQEDYEPDEFFEFPDDLSKRQIETNQNFDQAINAVKIDNKLELQEDLAILQKRVDDARKVIRQIPIAKAVAVDKQSSNLMRHKSDDKQKPNDLADKLVVDSNSKPSNLTDKNIAAGNVELSNVVDKKHSGNNVMADENAVSKLSNMLKNSNPSIAVNNNKNAAKESNQNQNNLADSNAISDKAVQNLYTASYSKAADIQHITQQSSDINVNINEQIVDTKIASPSRDNIFLPYTKISYPSDEMNQVKEKLTSLIQEKSIQNSKQVLEQKSIDIENLLKKYF